MIIKTSIAFRLNRFTLAPVKSCGITQSKATLQPMQIMHRVGVIHLSNGGFTIVDPERVGELNQFPWRLVKGYPCTQRMNCGVTLRASLHRVVMNAQNGQRVDHANRNPLDNRIGNLRFASISQNAANKCKPKSGKTSKFKGVSRVKDRNKWMACIKQNGKSKNLGHFDSEIDAAKAYNCAAIVRFKEFARLNEIP